MDSSRQFITEYIEALSGKSKDPAVIAYYVADSALAAHIAAFEEAFPGYQMTVEDLITEDDRAVVRATLSGNHRGTFAGIAATGRNISAEAIIIYKIAQGKIVQHWIQWNPAALVQQLTNTSAAAG